MRPVPFLSRGAAALATAALAAACSVDPATFTDVDGGVTVDASVDGSPPGVMLDISPADLVVDDAAQATFTVALTAPPAGTVVVELCDVDPDVIATAPASVLLFDAATWDTPQTVTVSAKADPDTADDTTELGLWSQDAGAATVIITVTDDDELGIVATPGALEVGESATTTLGVRLSAEPPGDVVVTASTDDPAIASVLPATLTFTPATWDTEQTVTVSRPRRRRHGDGATTVTLASDSVPGIGSRLADVHDREL